jgi:3-oxoacyl-(acyl-carrier-protein) synthase
VAQFWQQLLSGQCGLGPISRFPLEGSPYAHGGEVRGFVLRPWEECGLSAGAQFALEAGRQAADGLPADRRLSLAVVLATNFGPVERIAEGIRSAWAREDDVRFLAAGPYADDVRSVAARLGAGGPSAGLSLSCASGNAAVVQALALIRSGRAQAALACGYDSIQRSSWAGLSVLRVMALGRDGRPPQVRPFDKDRSGTIFSEGAGCLLLESEAAALERGAPLLAEVCGGAAGNDAYHMTHADPEGSGTQAVIRMALEDADADPDEVDCVNAHGTGTKLNDLTEARALHAVFGARAASIPVTSLKGGLGHAMGAAGSLELIADVMTLAEGIIPPTVNHEVTDPEIGLDVVSGQPRRAPVRMVLDNSAGIGGTNAAVVLRRLVAEEEPSADA